MYVKSTVRVEEMGGHVKRLQENIRGWKIQNLVVELRYMNRSKELVRQYFNLVWAAAAADHTWICWSEASSSATKVTL
jgi:hypothetical protein